MIVNVKAVMMFSDMLLLCIDGCWQLLVLERSGWGTAAILFGFIVVHQKVLKKVVVCLEIEKLEINYDIIGCYIP